MDAGHERRLENLRQWRDRRGTIEDLSFIKKQFEREIAKPHKQLGSIVPLWQKQIPDGLQEHTSLQSLARGVLLVEVTDSAALFELDRLLRSGIEREIRRQFAGTLRRIKLVQAGESNL